MKASELTVGLVAAATERTGRFDRSSKDVSKVEILAEPKSGHVRVKLLSLGARGFRDWKPGRSGLSAEVGEERRLPTRAIWMPWSNYETRLGNEAEQRKQKEDEDAWIERQCTDLQHRLDQFAGEVDERIQWDGYAHRPDLSTVKVPRRALEILLDRAEGK